MTEVTKAEEQQAAKPPARRYEIIQPGEYVARCAYILPNLCQCWKAGERRVFEEVLHPEKDGPKVREYQFCERHVRIQRAIDAGILVKENVNTTLKEQLIDPPVLPEEVTKPPKQEVKTSEQEKASQQAIGQNYSQKEKEDSQKEQEVSGRTEVQHGITHEDSARAASQQRLNPTGPREPEASARVGTGPEQQQKPQPIPPAAGAAQARPAAGVETAGPSAHPPAGADAQGRTPPPKVQGGTSGGKS